MLEQMCNEINVKWVAQFTHNQKMSIVVKRYYNKS